MLNSVRKIGPVLDLFTPERPEWRLTEIAQALQMPKSSAHALVTTLAGLGLLTVGSRGRYRLGWNVLSLSERMRAGHDFGRHALPVMRKLSAFTGETVLIGGLDRHEVVYAERVDGTHPTARLAGGRMGKRAPAHATAIGKVLLAHREPREVRGLLRKTGLPALTPRTITSLAGLEAVLAAVRTDGVAFNDQEANSNIACLAAPVRDRFGSVIVALSISVPARRFERASTSMVEPLKLAASAISRRLAVASAVAEQTPSVEARAAVG